MISHTYSKEEDSKKENCCITIGDYFIQKMSLISYFAGEKVIVGKVLATICIIVTYLKFLGVITFLIPFKGVISAPFQSVIKIINQTDFFLDQAEIYLIVIILLFTFNIIYAICFTVIFFTIKSKDNSHFIYNLVELYQIMNIINFWLFFCLEIELGLIVLLKLTTLNSAFQSISIINIIMTTLISIVYCFFGNKVEFNFELCDYFSRLDTRCEFYLLFAKAFFSVNFSIKYIMDSSNYNINLYLIINLVIVIFMIWFLTTYSFYYYNIINMLLLYFNLSTTYAALISFVIYNVPTIDGQDFLVLIGYLMLYPVAHFIMNNYWNRLLMKIPFVEIKQDHVLCKYMSMLIYLVCEENLAEAERLKLVGIMKQHQINCVFDDCVCKEKPGFELHIPKTEAKYLIETENFGYEHSKIYFKHLVKKIFEFLIKVTRNNNINLIMMFSYFMFFYIGNYHYSMYVLLNLKKNKNLNAQQKASLNRIFEMIHHKIESINNGQMRRVMADGKDHFFKVDFDRIILFYEKVTKLKLSINYALEFSNQFWTYIQNRVEINIIKKNGLEFYKFHNSIEETYKEINKIYDRLNEVNLCYYKYKAAVFGEPVKDFSSMEHFPSIEEKLQENEKFYNPKSVIVIANLTDKNKAIIEKISDNIKGLLNYSPSECLGQDVKLLMPNFYKIRHNNFIQYHFETGVNKVVNQEKPLFALHSNYYSIPIMMSIKMLPNYSSHVFYVGVLREITTDYDFIITTDNGKIEMISKGIFNQLFLSGNYIQLFNHIDYHIHFICKEYIEEINRIYDDDYKLTDFTKPNNEGQEYKYALLHFKSDALIDNILREFKKSENSSNNLSPSNHQTLIEGPLTKIFHLKDKIAQNFKKDSLKRYVTIEKFNVYLNENLNLFKLYSNINSDGLVNLDEIQIIDKYIQQNDEYPDEENQSLRLLYGFPSTHSVSKPGNEIKDFNRAALSKGADFFFQLREDSKKNDLYYQGKRMKIDKESFKRYLSIKKRYSHKRAYGEVQVTVLYNILFLICMLTLITYNYFLKEQKILKIFTSLDSEYFKVLPIYLHLATIDKNYIVFLEMKNYLSTKTEYLEEIFQDTVNSYQSFDDELKDFHVMSYEFSDDFLEKLSQEITFERTGYFPLSMTIENALLTLVSHIGMVTSQETIQFENPHVDIVNKNLNYDFFSKLNILFNGSLDSTKIKVADLIATKGIFNLLVILLIVSFGIYVYARILCYYWRQNRMISLLLSIDESHCKDIINSIRHLKIENQKKGNAKEEEAPEEEKNDDDEETEMVAKENNVNADDTPYRIKKKNGVVKFGGNAMNNQINNANNITSSTNAASPRVKQSDKNNLKKPRKKKKRAHINKYSISSTVYFTFFLRVVMIILVTLSPFIYALSNLFFEEKCNMFIDLIKNLNTNQFAFISSFLNFQEIIVSKTLANQSLAYTLDFISELKTNQFKTTNLFFDTLNGLQNEDEFRNFFSKKFCGYMVNNTFCTMPKSPYKDQGLLYILNINVDIMEDMIRNTAITSDSKSSEDIRTHINDDRYTLADQTFNLMSRFGFNQLSTYLSKSLQEFVLSYENQFLIIFIFNIICVILNQLVSIWLMKHIIEVVDVELKNIFSLMPYSIVCSSQNIYDLLSK